MDSVYLQTIRLLMDTNGFRFEWVLPPRTKSRDTCRPWPALTGTMSGPKISLLHNWSSDESYLELATFQNYLLDEIHNQGTHDGLGGQVPQIRRQQNDTALPVGAQFLLLGEFVRILQQWSRQQCLPEHDVCPGPDQGIGSRRSLDFLYDLCDTVLKGLNWPITDGTDIEADKNFMGSVKSTIKAAFKAQNRTLVGFGVKCPRPRVPRDNQHDRF